MTERLKSQQREYEAQMEHRKHVQEFIDKFRFNAKRASLVQSRFDQTVGQKIKKKSRPDSWNQIYQFHEKKFEQIPFFAISKMAKINFCTRKKFKTPKNAISQTKIDFTSFFAWTFF